MIHDDGRNIGIGIGYQITKLENFLINFITKYFKLILRFLVNKYKEIFRKIIFHFKSSKNLSYYSKCLILISLLLLITKITVQFYKRDKKTIFNKTSSNIFFLKNASNKKFSFCEDKLLFVVNRELNYEKIKKYIKSHKEKLKKLNIESNENLEDPYFKLMKFYVEYNKSNSNINKKII